MEANGVAQTLKDPPHQRHGNGNHTQGSDQTPLPSRVLAEVYSHSRFIRTFRSDAHHLPGSSQTPTKSPLLLRESHSHRPAALAQLREDTWLSPVSLLCLCPSISRLPFHHHPRQKLHPCPPN